MLVISMSDFLSNPAEYMKRAHHTAVLVENAGETPLTISPRRNNGKITPEELFTDSKTDREKLLDEMISMWKPAEHEISLNGTKEAAEAMRRRYENSFS